jgi:hypothetical protein
MSKDLEELYELEKELQEKMKDHFIPTKNKNWIPEKQFLKKQLEKKKYKSLKNVDFETLLKLEMDLIKEQEKEIKQKLKVVNPLPPDPGVYSGARTQRPKKPKKNNNNIFANSLTTFTSDFYLQRYCMQQKF